MAGRQKTVRFRPLGLYTYPNQYSAPDGAMSAATDIFVDRSGVVEAQRLGYDAFKHPALTGLFTGLANPTNIYSGTRSSELLVQTCYQLNSGGIHRFIFGDIFGIAGGSAVDWGAPGGPILSTFEANKNLYISVGGAMGEVPYGTTAAALLRSEASGSFVSRGCGMPEAPVPMFYVGTDGGGTTQSAFGIAGLINYAKNASKYDGRTWGGADTTANQRAYRVLFSYKDSNGGLVRGAPSGRLIVFQPGEDFGVLVFGLDKLAVGDIVQLYCSELQPTKDPSGTSYPNLGEPSDDMRLTYEYIVQSGDISNGYITIQDIATDGVRGTALYTNDYNSGILNSEFPPPPAAYSAFFKNTAFYSGVSWPGYSALTMNIIGVSNTGTGYWDPANIPSFTVNGVTYSANVSGGAFVASSDLPNAKWQLYTAANHPTYGSGQLLFSTAQAICACINYNNTSNVLAVYATPPNSSQAVILIKYFGGGAVASTTQIAQTANAPDTCTVSGTNLPAGTISPRLPANTAYDQTLSRVYLSRPNQPEAVPLTNYVTVGSPSVPVTGMAYLRDSLFVFKPEGTFRITGTGMSDVRVESFDRTTKMYPGRFRTIATAGNQIFCLVNHGVVSVTETGVTVLSTPIEDQLYPYNSASDVASTQINYPLSSSAAASDVEKKYALLVFTNGLGGQSASSVKIFIYNFMTRAWVTRTPEDSSNSNCVGMFSPVGKPEQLVFTSQASNVCKAMYDVLNIGVAGKYQPGPTWTYAYTETENPTVLKRWSDVKVVYGGSGSITSITASISSDSGASSSDITPTLYNGTTAVFQVPPDHALSSRLKIQITASTANNPFYVSEVQASYDTVGDWSAK